MQGRIDELIFAVPEDLFGVLDARVPEATVDPD
jgi:hypothetical protein